MKRRPVWLLDVDGTLCAPDPTAWGDLPQTAKVVAGVRRRERSLTWSPRLVREVGRFARSGLVEVRWCTAWGPWTDQLEELWDLPPLSNAVPSPSPPLATGVAKLAAADAILQDGHPLVWTDDDVPTEGPILSRLRAAGSFLVAPDPQHGLQPEDLQAVWSYLRSYQEPSGADAPTVTIAPYERRG